MIQEQFVGNGWAVLVSTLCVHKTTGLAALPAAQRVLSRWPTAAALRSDAYPSDDFEVPRLKTREDLEMMLQPLGMSSKRASQLLGLCVDLKRRGFPKTRDEALSYTGVGPYTADCYSVFALGIIPETLTTDKALVPKAAQLLSEHGRRLPWAAKEEA